MSNYDKEAIAKLRFENAMRCLNSANILSEDGDYKSAANRSYYAVFYAIRAVLALEGKDFKKHSAVISYFRMKYIKTGIFETKLSTIISEMFELRSDSDYDDFFIISKNEITEQILKAGLFTSAVKNYLINQGIDLAEI